MLEKKGKESTENATHFECSFGKTRERKKKKINE